MKIGDKLKPIEVIAIFFIIVVILIILIPVKKEGLSEINLALENNPAAEEELTFPEEEQIIYTKFYTKSVANARECPAISCRVVKQYSQNSELELVYESLETMPEWVTIFYESEAGIIKAGYMNKVVFSALPVAITVPLKLKEETEIPPPVSEVSLKEIASVAISESIPENAIDIQTVVLVRCSFRSQYFDVSTQPWNEEGHRLGSGIIISPQGYVLTAKHLLDVPAELLNDPAGRVWTRTKCVIAQTDKNQTGISAISFWGKEEDPRLKEAQIFFEPTSEDYRNGFGLDFTILKIKNISDLPYVNLFPYLIQFKGKDPSVAIGYPGRVSVSPQQLERFDGEFSTLTYYSDSACDGSVKPCGFRYFFKRYPLDYEKDLYKKTDLGVVTPYYRTGFSGSPVFYRGNLIGIITHGASGTAGSDDVESESGWDEAYILTSYDIFETFKKYLIYF